MKRCPKCGGEIFYVTAHVVQEWKVDKNEEFIKCIDDCIEVSHFPDNEDLWHCASCGYDDSGEKFNVKEVK